MRRTLASCAALARFTTITTRHTAAAALSTRRGASPVELERRAQRWAAELCRTLNVRVQHRGTPAAQADLLVANHRSYLDVVALLHGAPCGLLAKAEVGDWPVVGAACRAGGVTLVQREHRGSRKAARAALVARTQAGGRAALFPEGTTSAGPGCLPFRPGMFHAASEAGLRLQPVAIHYADTAVPYVDDDSFLPHFLGVFRRPRVQAHVTWGPVMHGQDGEDLRQRAQGWVSAALAELERAHPIAG